MDDDTFTADCDHCGGEFQSDIPLWSDFDELEKTLNELLRVLNPCGWHPRWFCSEKCQREAIEQARQKNEEAK